jgi:hypothetical protein
MMTPENNIRLTSLEEPLADTNDAEDMMLWPPAEVTLPYQCVNGVFPAAQLDWSVERLPVNMRTQNHGAQHQDQWIERRPRVVEVDSVAAVVVVADELVVINPWSSESWSR